MIDETPQPDPAAMAKFLVEDLKNTIGRQPSAEAMTDAIAAAVAREYPGATDATIASALNIAQELLRSDDLFRRSMEPLRAIQPASLTGLDIGDPEHGEPICERVDPRELFVDPLYQRSIGERGARQIREIIEGWDWNKFKPPICAYAEHGGKTVLKVLDGQHTAIAAASHPKIGLIPVMIVEASTTADQASSFVGQNTGRLAVTPLQLHKSALVAEDPDAVTVANVCGRAGIKILNTTPKKFNPGETVAIAAINSIVDRLGAMKARIILEILAKAGFAPVSAPQIRAVEHLLTDDEYKDAITTDDLREAISSGWLTDQQEAKTLSVSHRWPFWKALAITWFRKTPKKRKPVQGRAA